MEKTGLKHTKTGKLEEMKTALEAATPPEWKIKRADNGEIIGVVDGSGREVMSPDHDHWAGWKVSFDNPNDAHLIANAPEWLSKLIAVAEAAEALAEYTKTHHAKSPSEDYVPSALLWDLFTALHGETPAQARARKALEELK